MRRQTPDKKQFEVVDIIPFPQYQIERQVVRKDLNLGVGNHGFILENFFSDVEAQYYIKTAEESGFKQLDKEYPSYYRNNERALLRSYELAKEIWNRIYKHLKYSDIVNIRPYGFNNEGTWMPIGINEVFKVSRYHPYGYFKQHIDGNFLRNENERSIFSVIIYLNDNFEGGQTRFVDSDVLVKPRTGDALIFNHDVKHEGKTVTNKSKYIIRTEIMFERTDYGYSVNPQAYVQNPNYQMVLDLFGQSDELERYGKVEEALQKYLEGLKIQSSIPTTDTTIDYSVPFLPPDVFFLLLEYLSQADLVRFMLTNKFFFKMVRHPKIWRNFFLNDFPIYDENKIRNLDPNAENPEIVDWYQKYRSKVFSEFADTLVVDFGSDSAKFGWAGDVEPFPPALMLEATNRTVQHHPHYMISGQSFDSRTLAIDWRLLTCPSGQTVGSYKGSARLKVSIDQIALPQDRISSNSSMNDVGNLIYYVGEKGSFVHTPYGTRGVWKSIANQLDINYHPLVLALPPEADDTYFEKIYRSVPSLAAKPAPIFALFAEGKTTGVVVSLGHGISYVSAVVNEKIVCTEYFDVTGRFLDMKLKELCHFTPIVDVSEDFEIFLYKFVREKYCFIPHDDSLVPSADIDIVCFAGFRMSPEARTLVAKYIFDNKENNIIQKVVSVISNSPAEKQAELYENILLSGGNTLYDGFVERFIMEMDIVREYDGKFHVIAPKDRLTNVWKGASLWVSGVSNIESQFTEPKKPANQYYY